ncbi:hypothetical protein GGQ65_000002 [Rhizobium fabae]|uniref:Uncharacterized protein n=1 Tax=Rhizobium fabae TaxID=573179 RepID=A0A7W6AZK5_9HYPH|nr:hypothetical protein [Rhizobium fabae]
MNANPFKGCIAISKKAVITLSALHFLFTTCCRKTRRSNQFA